MKALILLVSATLLATISNAQSKFYVMPSAGFGLSNAHQNIFDPNLNGRDISIKSIGNYNLQLTVGYEWKHWCIEAGFQYLKTGDKYDNLVFGTYYPTIMETSITHKYTHINVPLHVGYVIKTQSRFSFVPTLGVDFGFNLDEYAYNVTGNSKYKVKTSEEDFKQRFNPISIWGNAAARIEYKINERFAIIGGPGFQYMLTNFLKTPIVSSNFIASQRNYSLDFNAGVKVNL